MIDKIVRNSACIGCGLCASVLENEHCEMKLWADGFYYPEIKNKNIDDSIIGKLCPGIKVVDTKKHGVWGHVEAVADAWACDKYLRFRAASGGVSSALALYLIESKTVDGILQVGLVNNDFLHNELKVSKTRDDIFRNAQSRYAPALTLSSIKQILDEGSETYAFIGKPCDIAGIKNLLEVYPKYKSRILYTISIFCAGMPSYNASQQTWQQSGRSDSPIFLKYRGEGWPGSFKAVWGDGEEYEISYNDSWGKVLGRNLNFRCKICPDGIGLLADIAVGDSWNTKNGYPDFTDAEGKNFCFIRTKRGLKIFNEAVEQDYLKKTDLDVSKVKNMQRYQYDRRHIVGWRILSSNLLMGGLLNFSGLGLITLAFKSNIIKGLKEAKGTFVRLKRVKRNTKK